jgi:Protein of unknown function (DUF2877)
MTTARAVFGGTEALRVAGGSRTGVVRFVLRRGAYVQLGSDWLLLAPPDAPFGPLSLAIDRPLGLGSGVTVAVADGTLQVGEHVVSLDRARPRSPPAIQAGRDESPLAAESVRMLLPEAPTLLMPGLAALGDGHLPEAVAALAGLGEGLTPAGDDVLAGYAATCPALGLAEPSLAALAAERASPLGLAYLRCADRGELPDAGAWLLRAICGGCAEAVRDAVAGLRAWGASSGVALAWGIAVAFTHAEEVADGTPGTRA